MTKIRTTITVDPKLLEIAQHHRIRISTFLHNSLSEYLSKINNSKSLHTAEVSGSNPDKPTKRISNSSIWLPHLQQAKLNFF